MNTPPKWFYIVASIALIWNIIGLLAVAMNFMLTPEQIAMLPPEQQDLMKNTPMWSTAASSIAVITGTLGCIGLLIKKSFAKPLLLISIVALIAQDIALFIVQNATAVLGITPLIMQSFVMLIAIGLFVLSSKAKQNLWIN